MTESRWTAENRGALEALFRQQTDHARVAVFDADGTLWHEDLGEAFLRWLIAGRKLLNVDYGRDIWADYEEMVQTSQREAYCWAVQLMAGLSEVQLEGWCAEFWSLFRHKIMPEMQWLLRACNDAKITPWIISASNQWAVRAAVGDFGIPAERVIAMRTRVVDGMLTAEMAPPVTYAEGKAQAIRDTVGLAPVLAAGNSLWDFEMLAESTAVSLIINADENLERRSPPTWLRQHFPA